MLSEGEILVLIADAMPTVATVVLLLVSLGVIGYWVWTQWR